MWEHCHPVDLLTSVVISTPHINIRLKQRCGMWEHPVDLLTSVVISTPHINIRLKQRHGRVARVLLETAPLVSKRGAGGRQQSWPVDAASQHYTPKH